MKDFLKTTLAVIVGTCITLTAGFFFFIAIFGAIAALGESSEPVVPANAILKVDFSNPVTELGEEDAMAALQSLNFSSTKPIGILKTVKAIENAATDPAIKFIYLNLNSMNIGMANMEEVRNALEFAKQQGKGIVSYADNYSQGAYYLASVSDKIYLNSDGSAPIVGIGSSMMFFKDLLDKLGIQVQLICFSDRRGVFCGGGFFLRRALSGFFLLCAFSGSLLGPLSALFLFFLRGFLCGGGFLVGFLILGFFFSGLFCIRKSLFAVGNGAGELNIAFDIRVNCSLTYAQTRSDLPCLKSLG